MAPETPSRPSGMVHSYVNLVDREERDDEGEEEEEEDEEDEEEAEEVGDHTHTRSRNILAVLFFFQQLSTPASLSEMLRTEASLSFPASVYICSIGLCYNAPT